MLRLWKTGSYPEELPRYSVQEQRFGKQVASIATSQPIDDSEKDSFKYRAIGQCPVISVKVCDVDIPCLVDTGSMVSTITESFYRKFLEPLGKTLSEKCMLQLKAANGLTIPYIGYVEFDVKYCGNVLKQRGFLIVKDATDEFTRKRKEAVPGILGMNVLNLCRDILSNSDVPTDGI